MTGGPRPQRTFGSEAQRYSVCKEDPQKYNGKILGVGQNNPVLFVSVTHSAASLVVHL